MKTTSVVTKSGAATQADMRVDAQIYTVGVSVVGISACAIGLWAAASIIGGVIASGGPVGLIADWFKAVFGI